MEGIFQDLKFSQIIELRIERNMLKKVKSEDTEKKLGELDYSTDILFYCENIPRKYV